MGTLYLIVASTLWGVIHSILASHTVKDAARRFFGPASDRLYRFSYNIFSAASIFPILLMLFTFPDQPLYAIPEPWVYLSVLIQGAAFFALVAGVMQTGPFEFAGLTQLAGLEPGTPPRLVTDGLYAHVRHPLYTAGLAFLWAWPDMTVNRLAVWIVFSLYLLIGAWFEERKLLKDFGQEYADYKARTPMLLPKIKFGSERK
ncbi:MAG: isoprenylcysteine carboxylmethyltransferase family protein [Anaerolineales bacterium]